MALSQDGTLLAVHTGGKVVIWDVALKRASTELAAGARGALAFSPTGGVLAFYRRQPDGRHEVVCWNVQTRQSNRTFALSDELISLAFSPDGAFLASFANNGTIQLMEHASGRMFTSFSVPTPRRGGAGVVMFAPWDSQLAIGEDFGKLQLVNWRTGKVLPIQTQTTDGVSALAFSARDRLLAAGFLYTSGTISLRDTKTGELDARLSSHTGWISALAFAPDGSRLASASRDRSIRLWDMATRKEIRCLRGHSGHAVGLAFLPDGSMLISGGSDGTIRFWDVTDDSRDASDSSLVISHGVPPSGLSLTHFAREALDPKVVNRLGLAFDPDSQTFLTTDREGTLGRWSATSMRRIEYLPAVGSNLWAVALSPDGRWLVTADTTGRVNFWDWQQRRLTCSSVIPFEWSGYFRFSPSGKFLLACIYTNVRKPLLRIWQVDSWNEIPLPSSQIAGLWALAVSPDDRLLALGYVDGAVKLRTFPTETAEVAVTQHRAPITTLLFSGNGDTLVCTSTDGQITLWDTKTHQPSATLSGQESVWSAAFSPDGRRLATGGIGPQDAVRLWDLATLRTLLTFHTEGQFVITLAFSPDGNTLAATLLDGKAYLWRAPSWTEIEGREQQAHVR